MSERLLAASHGHPNGITETAKTLQQYATDGRLLHGSRAPGLQVLSAGKRQQNVARNMNDELISVPPHIFATRDFNLAIFAGAVWRRGWSGWYTYLEPDGSVYHEFFAAPHVIREALSRTASVYTVSAHHFSDYPEIAGQYVTPDDISVLGEYEVSIHDMTAPILGAAYLHRASYNRVIANAGSLPPLDPSYFEELDTSPPWETSKFPEDPAKVHALHHGITDPIAVIMRSCPVVV